LVDTSHCPGSAEPLFLTQAAAGVVLSSHIQSVFAFRERGDASGGYGRSRRNCHHRPHRARNLNRLEDLPQVGAGADDRADNRDAVEDGFEDRDRDVVGPTPRLRNTEGTPTGVTASSGALPPVRSTGGRPGNVMETCPWTERTPPPAAQASSTPPTCLSSRTCVPIAPPLPRHIAPPLLTTSAASNQTGRRTHRTINRQAFIGVTSRESFARSTALLCR
jgi:hypothetical protein